jgi:TetR/AcrR family transcriptional repressor of nem operon
MSLARTAQIDSPTKQRLLDAAEGLMLSKGFAATTVDEICEAAKVTKGSFFHYFESKDQLGKQVLERFCTSGQKRHAAFCGSETDPLKRVYHYIDTAIKMAKDPAMSQGCLLGLFAQELCDTNPEIRAACKEGFDDWARGFGQEVAKAKARYAPQASFSPQGLAEYFIAVMEGSMILGKTRQDMSIVAKNLSHVKAYIKSLFEGTA